MAKIVLQHALGFVLPLLAWTLRSVIQVYVSSGILVLNNLMFLCPNLGKLDGMFLCHEGLLNL